MKDSSVAYVDTGGLSVLEYLTFLWNGDPSSYTVDSLWELVMKQSFSKEDWENDASGSMRRISRKDVEKFLDGWN